MVTKENSLPTELGTIEEINNIEGWATYRL